MKSEDLEKGIDNSKIIEVDMTDYEMVIVELPESTAEDLKEIRIRIISNSMKELRDEDTWRKRCLTLIIDADSVPVVPEAELIPVLDLTAQIKELDKIRQTTMQEARNFIVATENKFDDLPVIETLLKHGTIDNEGIIDAVFREIFELFDDYMKGFNK